MMFHLSKDINRSNVAILALCQKTEVLADRACDAWDRTAAYAG